MLDDAPVFNDILPPMIDEANHVSDLVGARGLQETVWKVTNPADVATIEKMLDVDLFLVDGHHRLKAAKRMWAPYIPTAFYDFRNLLSLAFHREIGGITLAQIVPAIEAMRNDSYPIRVVDFVPESQYELIKTRTVGQIPILGELDGVKGWLIVYMPEASRSDGGIEPFRLREFLNKLDRFELAVSYPDETEVQSKSFPANTVVGVMNRTPLRSWANLKEKSNEPKASCFAEPGKAEVFSIAAPVNQVRR